MDSYYLSVYEKILCGVGGIFGDCPDLNRYFSKTIRVILPEVTINNSIMRPNDNFYLELDNPNIYEIIDCLVDAYLNNKNITVFVSGTYLRVIHFEEEISEDRKRNNVINSCLFAFKNERDMVKDSWEKYLHYSNEDKSKFWRLILGRRKRMLEYCGCNPYYMFAPEIYQFWLIKEPNIDDYLVEVIPKLKFDMSRVELGINKRLKH
jgi:hypothetical protein